MLGHVAPTPYDLRFSLFGIPIRVHPFFWIMTALMGWDGDEIQLTFIWIGCVFLSILVHEFGHALTARYFGWPPEVVLYHFGGYAAFQPHWGYTTGRAIFVLLNGPGAGFLLYGVTLIVQYMLVENRLFPEDETQRWYVLYALFQMKYINLWWGLVNLLPVFPLDGGQIARHLITQWRRHDGWEMSLKLSLITAIGVAVYFFMHDVRYAGLMFALLAVSSYQELQQGMYR